MIETKKKTIDGDEYSVTQFPARRGLSLKIRLVKILGPALAEAASGLDLKDGGNLQDTELDSGFLAKAVSKLVEGLDSSTGDLILEMLSQTRKNGHELTEAVFDLEFAGNYMTLYKLLAFVIQANGFFPGGGIGFLTPPAKAEPETESTSKSA